MNISKDTKERRMAWGMLIFGPLSIMFIFLLVTLDMVPGLAYHPKEYLQSTCIMWALVIMILLVLRLLRLVALPLWFNIFVYANIYLYVISLCIGLYKSSVWWGYFTHVVSAMIVAGFVFIALCLMQTHSPPHVQFGSNGGLVVVLFVVAMSFGGIWEMMEGMVDLLSGKAYMTYGALDTLGDLASNSMGMAIVSVAAYIILNKHDAEYVASKVRFGRKAFETTK